MTGPLLGHVVGQPVLGDQSYILAVNDLRTARFSAGQDGKLAKLSALLDGLGGGTGVQALRMVLYTGAGDLVAQSEETMVAEGDALASVDFALAEPVAYEAGLVMVGIHAGTSSRVARVWGADPAGRGGAWQQSAYVSGAPAELEPQVADVRPGNPSRASVLVQDASAVVVAPNLARTGLVVTNRSTHWIALGLGEDAVLWTGIVLGPDGGTWEMGPETFTRGSVYAVATADDSRLAIQEYSATGASGLITNDLSVWGTRFDPWSAPEGLSEFFYARMPFEASQVKLGEEKPVRRGATAARRATCGWWGDGWNQEEDAFAVVQDGGEFADLVGKRIKLTRRERGANRSVVAFVQGSARIPDDVFVTRRLFLALGLPALDRIVVRVEELSA